MHLNKANCAIDCGGFDWRDRQRRNPSKHGLEEFKHPEINRLEEPKKARENFDAPIIEDWVSDDEEEVESIPKVEKTIPTATKKESVKTVKPSRKTGSKMIKDLWIEDAQWHISGNIAHLSDFQRLLMLPDESQILLKIPRQNNMYSFDMKNIVPKDGLTCLVAKATSEESMLWHRRLDLQFKTKKDEQLLYSDLGFLSAILWGRKDSPEAMKESNSLQFKATNEWVLLICLKVKGKCYKLGPTETRKREGIVDRNKAHLFMFAQDITQEEGIDYDEVVQQKKKGIFISQDKYVHEILKKFNYTDVKSASTLLLHTELEKPWIKMPECRLMIEEHLYRSMIGSYDLSNRSRPEYHDCKIVHSARLIFLQCKKQTVVATSTTEAEYVAAASCCGQVLWIQNQLLDYGTAPIAKSLASHMSSNGKSQSGAIKIGVPVNFLLSVLKDSIHSFENKNGVSFSSR
ncbi:hypothetical protein Tco_0909618 [Tanacetum coccineum]|uniref:Reverse transcriptase Ty1/copia-type domain-containing protein n=1 Tax=Tanacetum coccineum TaxID=301880 RepID=A0ABQ5CSP5_9ASTR